MKYLPIKMPGASQAFFGSHPDGSIKIAI